MADKKPWDVALSVAADVRTEPQYRIASGVTAIAMMLDYLLDVTEVEETPEPTPVPGDVINAAFLNELIAATKKGH